MWKIYGTIHGEIKLLLEDEEINIFFSFLCTLDHFTKLEENKLLYANLDFLHFLFVSENS